MSLTILAKFIQDIQVLNPMSVSLFLSHSTPINIWSQALLPSWTPLAYRVEDAVFPNRHHFLWVLCQLLIFYLSSQWESLRSAFWAPHSLRVSGAHLASKAASPQMLSSSSVCLTHTEVFHRLCLTALKSSLASLVVLCLVMSNSVQPHGPQPVRLLCPWGFSKQEYCSRLPCSPPGVRVLEI